MIKAGTIAIVGRPNVGKSTLMNRFVGEKVSIVSRKAQTTRHRILGILSEGQTQYVFVDTPGYQRHYKNKLNVAMNRQVTTTLVDVDVVMMVVECGRLTDADRLVATLLPKSIPVILTANKADQLSDRAKMMAFLAAVQQLHDFAAIVPVSAQNSWQLTDLKAELARFLPEQAFLYDENEITDKNDTFIAAEFIREKLFRLLGDELPYAATVEIEQIERLGNLRRIFAAIIVDRDNHKAIILGKGGQHLKRIASEARVDIEKLFDCKVYLEIWVKVRSGWANNEQLLQQSGLPLR